MLSPQVGQIEGSGPLTIQAGPRAFTTGSSAGCVSAYSYQGGAAGAGSLSQPTSQVRHAHTAASIRVAATR